RAAGGHPRAAARGERPNDGHQLDRTTAPASSVRRRGSRWRHRRPRASLRAGRRFERERVRARGVTVTTRRRLRSMVRDDGERRTRMSVDTVRDGRAAAETRLRAGIGVAESPLIAAAIEYARRLSEPYLFNHAMRSWLFAETIGRAKRLDYDHE